MFIQLLYTDPLAQASYYIESDGQAMVIDPMREPEPYLDLARRRNAKIKYIFETHFHSDFVSGHLELSKRTGAVIIFGPGAKTKFQALTVFDGEVFYLGSLLFKILHTPGHTIESSCLLLHDENKKPYCIFTGDTLFNGDVGRPYYHKDDKTREELTGLLYESLNKKIRVLPDDLLVYPGHGEGSMCGKSIAKNIPTTIGEQKRYNLSMMFQNKDIFIKSHNDYSPEITGDFIRESEINKNGYETLDVLLKKEYHSLDLDRFKEEINLGAFVIDTRDADAFGAAFIPGSINIGLNGEYEIFAASFLNYNKPTLLVCEPGKEKESILRLARIGYHHVTGFLSGGIETWIKSKSLLNTVKSIDYSEFIADLSPDRKTLIDVRRVEEFKKRSIEGAINIPLQRLKDEIKCLNKEKELMLYCAGGYRSMIAASYLLREGFSKITNLKGGIDSGEHIAA